MAKIHIYNGERLLCRKELKNEPYRSFGHIGAIPDDMACALCVKTAEKQFNSWLSANDKPETNIASTADVSRLYNELVGAT